MSLCLQKQRSQKWTSWLCRTPGVCQVQGEAEVWPQKIVWLNIWKQCSAVRPCPGSFPTPQCLLNHPYRTVAGLKHPWVLFSQGRLYRERREWRLQGCASGRSSGRWGRRAAITEWEEMGIWITSPLSLLVSATRNFKLQCNFQVRATMVEKEKPNEMLTV